MILLDGKKTAQIICDELKIKVSKNKNLSKPNLVVFLIGDVPESRVYVNAKIKRCEEIGFNATLIHLNNNINENDLINKIKEKANDKNVNGIMVQLPLPKHFNENKIISFIPPNKDVDGMHYENLGKICYNDKEGIISATPLGILMLLEHYNIETTGKNAVVVGRSQIVGRPISILLSSALPQGNCTVTICHSKTKNLNEILKNADIIIAAIGIPLFIKADMIKKGVVIIDVGINSIKTNENTKGYKLVGDVDFENVSHLCSAITPVPGGVGPMTIAALMNNIYKVYIQQTN